MMLEEVRALLLTTIIISTAIWTSLETPPPVVRVTADDAEIRESCTLVIPPGTVIEDTNGDGVVHITASDIEVRFAPGSRLRGAPVGRPPDEYRGYGIRLAGHSNVTIRDAHLSGFWGGLWATDADGLTLDAVDASDNRRARLKSTPAAEDAGDWLFPHDNDQNEWLTNYGAALYVEDSNGVTVRNCRVRHGQNALCLDRVNDSRIYDNDFSFNSGWGIALWRCRRNAITRNACDFCVRGYSHGVYNRGQDSAGILMFEQNCDNVIAENSATHSGDGFFGFAGREALGEAGEHPADWYRRRGNNGNLLIGNDFSYAPAHGIEMTFSFGNVFYDNRLVENAICGVWGGYSQDTLIARNHLEGNGQMAYGLERGGINIEHGRGNRILDNDFRANACGVHLWWTPAEDFARKPWARANGIESKDNLVAGNRFAGDKLAFHLRGRGELGLGANTLAGVEQEMLKDADIAIRKSVDPNAPPAPPTFTAYGTTRPVGARRHLAGRQNIIMTEWGPWDHEAPLVRPAQDDGASVCYDLYQLAPGAKVTVEGRHVTGRFHAAENAEHKATYTVAADQPGVYPYRVRLQAGDWEQEVRGTLVAATWDATFFPWTAAADPREDLAAWRKLAQAPGAVSGRVGQLRFPYGWGGPGDLKLSPAFTPARLGGDHFGMIARTRLPLAAGAWEFATLSDDGVRVIVDGTPIIDNWTWHGPTRNAGVLTLPADKTVEVVVEHFEIDGYAVLELGISAQDPPVPK
jgi:parallel beta-helix repeat protein